MKTKWDFILKKFKVFFSKTFQTKYHSWCTHSFLNHSKGTYNEKDMGFQTREV
jgi:hypothetical protein